MTMFLAPYTAIADIDGSPLDAGFIYFGEFGKDPESHPIAVYWDADFTVPAAQPIRTRNGYPIRNGSPCKIYLKQAEHSLVVKNKNLSAILVEMNNKGISSSLLVRPDGNTVETSLVEIDAALETKASNEYVDNQLSLKAPQATTYTKIEVDNALSTKAPQSNTYTKAEVDTTFAAYVGGRKAYTTLALAQADQANLTANTAIEVTNDGANNGTYQWNGTTLTKSDYDPLTQAKNYTDSLLEIEGNIYETINNISTYYVRTSDDTIQAATGTMLNIFPVEAGKTYSIKSASINSTHLAVVLRATRDTSAGATLGRANFSNTSDPNIKTFTVPADSTANYALITVKLPSQSIDITNDLDIREGEIYSNKDKLISVNGAAPVDQFARENMLSKQDVLLTENLYKTAQNFAGKYIRTTDYQLLPATTTTVNIFPITAGYTYAIKSSQIGSSVFHVGTYPENTTVNGTLLTKRDLIATSDPTVKTFTVPADSPDKFAYINVVIPSQSFDVTNDLYINVGSSYINASNIAGIGGNQIADLDARKRIELLEITAKGSVLTGKSWAVIGDSITEKNWRANKNYHDFVSEQVGGMTVHNYGISSSGFWNRAQTIAASITQSPDYITLLWGANDITKGPDVLGDVDSVGTETQAGLINQALSDLITKFYDKKLGIITLLPRDIYNNVTNLNTNKGFTATQFADLLIAIAQKYSIPVLDLYRESNLYPWIPAANALYFTAPGETSPDGLHPNDAGQEAISNKIRSFLESL